MKELCALVDESLLKLSVVDLVDVATCLGVREGRLKDQQGKNKSKLVILREISQFLEKKCDSDESVDTSLELLQRLYNDVQDLLKKPEYASATKIVKPAKERKKRVKSKADGKDAVSEEGKVDSEKVGSVKETVPSEMEHDSSVVVDDDQDTSVGNKDKDVETEEGDVTTDVEKEKELEVEKSMNERTSLDESEKKTDSSDGEESDVSDNPESVEESDQKIRGESEKSGESADEEKKIELEMKMLEDF